MRKVVARARAIAGLVLLAAWGSAHAGGGPFGIDYRWQLDESGIWARHYQLGLAYAVIGTAGAGALWLGNDNRLGHTFWQSVDSEVLSGLAAEGLKYAFSRARPDQGNNPDLWFQGHGYQSFPSGEVTLQAAFVTPLIFQYVHENRWIIALEVLPLYDAIARMKSQAHWQSDVLAGWMLGTGVGYWTSTWKVPMFVRILPGGMSIGLSKHF